MDVDPIAILVFLVSLAILWFAVAVELALTISDRSEIRKMSEKGDRHAAAAEGLLQDPDRLLLSSMLLKTLGMVGLGGAVVRLLPAGAATAQFLIALVAMWALGAFVRVSGRSAAARWPQAIGLRGASIMKFLTILLWPGYALCRKAGSWLGEDNLEKIDGNVFLSEETIRLLIDVSDEEPILDSEKEMIASILDMDETVAREVMVPRIDVVALDVKTSLRDALNVVIEAGHSRVPVYEDNIDQIVGFLYAKDLLRCFQENRDDMPISSLLRPVYFVPETKKVNALMHEMQKRRVHVSMVVDEYGGTAGLVTIEDILEEIVGEIQDEYDEEEQRFVETVDEDNYIINARLDMYSLGELLGMDLSDEDADTLAGLLYSLMGHVPEQGESVVVDGWRFTVLALDGRRIERVRAERVKPLTEHGMILSDESVVHNDEFKYSLSK